ncbi:MAG TPA: hypothetical protein VHB21_07390 [Minicystis sp.]|nr:hypothetical protein [Minicystis sp.]
MSEIGSILVVPAALVLALASAGCTHPQGANAPAAGSVTMPGGETPSPGSNTTSANPGTAGMGAGSAPAGGASGGAAGGGH